MKLTKYTYQLIDLLVQSDRSCQLVVPSNYEREGTESVPKFASRKISLGQSQFAYLC